MAEGTFSQLLEAEDTFFRTSSSSPSSSPSSAASAAASTSASSASASGSGSASAGSSGGGGGGCRRVALKVLNARYRYIGEQETDTLRALNGKDARARAPVLRLLATFECGAHYCLVLELLHGSLLDYLVSSGSAGGSILVYLFNGLFCVWFVGCRSSSRAVRCRLIRRAKSPFNWSVAFSLVVCKVHFADVLMCVVVLCCVSR
jgi:hypothetical protein